ncbi:hypothetical protein [Sphingobacterium thalpophilum]|uniref:hypothetical protein n=1 Tax=Sphingobacterium thalpophilum TaxID=259 RepID=UPI003D9807D6
MKKVIFSLSFLALTTAAFAETKTETPSKTEGTAKLSVYYVTGISGPNYTLSTSPNPLCGDAEESPCEITSQNPITSSPLQAPKSQVDAQSNGFSIVERQPQL